MDRQTRAYYELLFKVAYMEKRGNAFQDLFSEIMEKCHPGDFQRVRPWGRDGDKKNDGYLRSSRALFQVYAPNEMTASDAIAKIDEDFYGALDYWRHDFDKWVFVHNAKDGLGPHIVKKINELTTLHRPIIIGSWGFEELRRKIFNLPEVDLAPLLGGYAPSTGDMQELRYENIKEVLTNIARQDLSPFQDIRPVPPDKLKFNRLSEDTQTLLTWGMQKADLVGNFFNNHPDPQYGDEIASAFNEQYRQCKELDMEADTIFFELQKFAAGQDLKPPRYQAAVLAVLAYLFEQCEIFERSSGEVIV
ncbi:MAG: hypothetical protein E6J34_10060 [Chloroflexi bacterium]|nr:MAG: hypothetical protein E6J34_10060 [Chloroflexota bacterium]